MGFLFGRLRARLIGMMDKSDDLNREFFVKQGRRGGKARAQSLSAEERVAIAKKANAARIAKRTKEKRKNGSQR